MSPFHETFSVTQNHSAFPSIFCIYREDPKEVIPTQGQMVLGKNINNPQRLFLYIFSIGGLLLLRSVYFKTLGFQDICFSGLLFYPYLKTQYLLPELGQVTYKCRGFS